MKYKSSISLLVLCIAALALVATVCGIFTNQGPGVHKFTTIYGQVVTIYGKGV